MLSYIYIHSCSLSLLSRLQHSSAESKQQSSVSHRSLGSVSVPLLHWKRQPSASDQLLRTISVPLLAWQRHLLWLCCRHTHYISKLPDSRQAFDEQLAQFYAKHGAVLSLPSIQHTPLDCYTIFNAVAQRGGFEGVSGTRSVFHGATAPSVCIRHNISLCFVPAVVEGCFEHS